MPDKPLIAAISPEFLSHAVEALPNLALGLEFKSIPFSMHQRRLEELSLAGHPDEFKTYEYGYFLNFRSERQEILGTVFSEQELCKYDGFEDEIQPAFSIESVEIGYDGNIPVILNSTLLDGVQVDRGIGAGYMPRFFSYQAIRDELDPDDAIEQDKVYVDPFNDYGLPKEINLPKSIIRTADGRVFFSSEDAQTLQTRLEQAQFDLLSEIAAHLEDHKASPDDSNGIIPPQA